MSSFEVYLIMKLDVLNFTLALFGWLMILAIGIGTTVSASDDEGLDYLEKAKKYIFWAVSLICITVILPTTKQVVSMIVIPPIVNNDKVQKIPKRLLDILDKNLSEILSEIETKTDDQENLN